MTQLTQGSDMELRELIESFFSTSMRASSPRKIDMMVDALKEHEQRSIDRAVADRLAHWAAFFEGTSMNAMTPSERLWKEVAELEQQLSPTTTEDNDQLKHKETT